MAQRFETRESVIDKAQLMQKFWLVAGQVKTVQGEPVRGAAVTVAPTDLRSNPVEDATELFPLNTSTTIVSTDAQGEFRANFSMVADITPSSTQF